ncbi:MAG TPA: adenylate/guanylate cyclase domain-containing protein [Fimbriimonadaceae bacterium]|nr:adenylate/guanylate cyclase domain-containing protein [Fimbriimonadaceae bacterium]
MSSTARRKLAAIVFADIAGYTDKTQRDEAGTLNVRDRVERLIKSATVSHNGRVVKTLGDGAMLEFASAVEAVSCALDIQDQMETLNADLASDEPVALRVGVHVGDVVEEADDIYGNAVNIASRVLGMAQPGGICITREVYVQIKPILKLSFAPVAGAVSDRLPEPVEVFAIVGGEDLHPQSAASTKSARRSPMLVAALAVAAIAVFAAAYSLFNSAANDPAKADNQVHRILLPDWVTPGEWFVLDAGEDRSKGLTVYFGNRKASTRIDNGQLLVQTPIDLPTAQTAISVFEGDAREPLLNQQTQVIKYGSLAMNSRGSLPTDSLGESSGPDVKIDSSPAQVPAQPVDLPNPPAGGAPKQNALPPSGTKPSATTSAPNATPAAPTPRSGSRDPKQLVVRVPSVPHVEGYDKMVTMVQNDDFKFQTIDMKELEKKFGPMGEAFKSLGLAQTGNRGAARRSIETTRVQLKSLEPAMAQEIEAILKTAEACLDEPAAPGARTGGRRPHPKWAEAFAFSMNKGTRSFPGIMMVDAQIRSGSLEEARRTLGAIKKRPDLTESERKAVANLESKLAEAQKGKTEAPSPGPSESN